MHFTRDIFTLLGVGSEAVLTNELETGVTFNDKMSLMMDLQLFFSLTNKATGVAGVITCRTIISTHVTKVSILIRVRREGTDRMATMITSENHPSHDI